MVTNSYSYQLAAIFTNKTFVHSIVDCRAIIITAFPLYLVDQITYDQRITRKLRRLTYKYPSGKVNNGIEIYFLADRLRNLQKKIATRITFRILKDQTSFSTSSTIKNLKGERERERGLRVWFPRGDFSPYTLTNP